MYKKDNTMEELLSLKWNNHRSTFLHILTVLRDKQLYTDATLACDGKLYSVHKLVLSTCSDYFSSMLDRTSCKSPVIVLKDIKCEDLEALLDYMYLGEVNVRQSDLATLIKAAECLRVKGLAVPDDEPPPPRKTRETQASRRGDTSGSPPAKRKRRSEVDDGRDDVRPAKQEIRQSSPIHSSSSSRPKSPVHNPPASTPLSPIQQNRTTPQRQPTEATIPPSPSRTIHTDDNTNMENNTPTKQNFDQVEPYVKVEMEEGGNAADCVETYDLSNDGAFKEEGDDNGASGDIGGGESGGDLSNDLPEFLQQAASGPLQGGAFPHSSFSGPSSFQPGDIPGWQGDGSNIGFSHLNFGTTEGSSQQNAPGGPAESRSLEVLLMWLDDERRCRVCRKQFLPVTSWKQRFDRHLNTHSGARPFACPHCPHQCSRKDALKLHVQRRHSATTTPIPESDFSETSNTPAVNYKSLSAKELSEISSSMEVFSQPDSEKFRQAALNSQTSRTESFLDRLYSASFGE